MNDQTTFRRVAAISAITAGPVGLGSWVLVALAVGGNFDAISDYTDVITLGTRAAGLFRTAWMLADAFGYLFLLAPAALYLWHWLKPRSSNLVTLYAIFGFAYIFTGGITVYLLGGAVPPMMRAYAEASGPERDAILAAFNTVFDMTFYGVGTLAWLFGGVWWLGTGLVLRHERRILGIVTAIQGVMSFGLWLGQAFHSGPLAVLQIVGDPLNLFTPVWAVWLGIVIARSGRMSEDAAAPTPS